MNRVNASTKIPVDIFGAWVFHHGPGLTLEITEAFEDFMLDTMLRGLSAPDAGHARELWEFQRVVVLSGLEDDIGNYKLPKNLMDYSVNLCFLMLLISKSPELWAEFKKNCGLDSVLDPRLKFFSK